MWEGYESKAIIRPAMRSLAGVSVGGLLVSAEESAEGVTPRFTSAFSMIIVVTSNLPNSTRDASSCAGEETLATRPQIGY